jgi:prephenate dehydratase
VRVAIQGELGSFSHAAAQKLLPRARVIACSLSADVFDALVRKKADQAVIPIENSLAGPVTEHFDLLLKHNFFIQRELRLKIEHNLIAPPGVKLRDIRQVLSHPVALQQCRRFFERHRNFESVPFYDTAGSVKHIVEACLVHAGAIAAVQAAKEYKAKILLRSIEDNKQNFTRFWLLGRSYKAQPRANKTSIVFSLRNLPGALFKALSVFALREIDLCQIESRPVPGKPWEYVFYADLLIGDTPQARRALAHLAEMAHFVKVLGIYSAA